MEPPPDEHSDHPKAPDTTQTPVDTTSTTIYVTNIGYPDGQQTRDLHAHKTTMGPSKDDECFETSGGTEFNTLVERGVFTMVPP